MTRALGRRRGVLARVALLLVSSIVGVGLLEVGARVWIERFATDEQFATYASIDQLRARIGSSSQAFSRYVPHRLLGYIPSPAFTLDGDRHNALGFRGPEFPRRKPPGEFRIVCLGGSTTYTTGVKEDRLAYPALLEATLHRRGYENVRVVNAGAAGYSSWESLASLQFRVLELEPDLVIIYHAVNDVLHRFIWPAEAYVGDDSGWSTHSPGFAAEPAPLERSSALRILLIRLGRAHSPLELERAIGTMSDSAVWWSYASQSRSGRYPQGLFRRTPAEKILAANPPDYFRRNLESMVAIARAHAVQPLLATFAQNRSGLDDPLNSPPVAAAIDEHNEIIREIGSRLDVPVFDFAAAFPQNPALHLDSVHVGKRGSALKAKLFAGFLSESGLLPKTANDLTDPRRDGTPRRSLPARLLGQER